MIQIPRYLSKKLKFLAKGFPAIFLTGPRQSGKTTLAKEVFQKYQYVSLESPHSLELALNDPIGFLKAYPAPCILDEIQKAPLLFSYLQGMIDESQKPGEWILTGSQQFLLMRNISQTLAGRCAMTTLLPLSLLEYQQIQHHDPLDSLLELHKTPPPKNELNEYIYRGFYPRLYHPHIQPIDWYDAYYQSYVTRDVRDILKIGDLNTFRKFVSACAARSGQILNLSSLGNEVGISHPTAKSWLSILEASSLIYLVPPHFKNFNKRLVKAPKLYFLDSGLLCHLLQLRSPNDITLHPLRGAIFETFIVSGIIKLFTHSGERPPLYYWRDQTGNEIDILLDLGTELLPIEIKSSYTLAKDHLKTLRWWLNLPGNSQKKGILYYAGDEAFRREEFLIHPWWHL